MTTTSKKPVEKVLLDGKVVGRIYRVTGGYQYFPSGSRDGSDVYASIASLRSSLGDSIVYKPVQP